MGKTLRNVLIILAIAVAVYALPGGGDAASIVGALLSTGIIVAFALAARFYRENRVGIYGLGDRWRAILYGAIAVAIFAMAARTRLFDIGGGGVLLWFALIGGAVFALYSVFRQYRTYA